MMKKVFLLGVLILVILFAVSQFLPAYAQDPNPQAEWLVNVPEAVQSSIVKANNCTHATASVDPATAGVLDPNDQLVVIPYSYCPKTGTAVIDVISIYAGYGNVSQTITGYVNVVESDENLLTTINVSGSNIPSTQGALVVPLNFENWDNATYRFDAVINLSTSDGLSIRTYRQSWYISFKNFQVFLPSIFKGVETVKPPCGVEVTYTHSGSSVPQTDFYPYVPNGDSDTAATIFTAWASTLTFKSTCPFQNVRIAKEGESYLNLGTTNPISMVVPGYVAGTTYYLTPGFKYYLEYDQDTLNRRTIPFRADP